MSAVKEALSRAKLLAKRGKIAEARQQYQSILSEFPQNKKARKELKKLPPAPPELTQQDVTQLQFLFSQGRLNEGLIEGRRLLEAHPNATFLHNILGVIYAQMGEVDAAISSYNQALKITPDDTDARNNLGAALYQIGKFEEAINCYDRVLKTKPRDAEVHYNLANALRSQGDISSAVSHYNQALEIDPGAAKVVSNLGIACKDLGKLDNAIEHFEHALQLQPNYIDALLNLGSAYEAKNCPEKSIEYYKRALIVDPNHLNAQHNLGKTYFRMEDHSAAINCFEKVLRINPGFAEAKHIHNALTGCTSESAPQEYVISMFDDYAARFETQLTGELEYSVPTLLKDMLLRNNLLSPERHNIVDLGCGTGLAGLEFKEFSKRLSGIDLSGEMLKLASDKNIYDKLYCGDLTDTLNSVATKFDLFIAADVFIYVGELRHTFEAIKQSTGQPSYLAFSTEHIEKGDFLLQTTGRYAHSEHYIRQAAATTGFSVAHIETVNLRKEHDRWISGALYILNIN